MSQARICFVVSSPLTARAFLSGHIAALSRGYQVDLAVDEGGPDGLGDIPSHAHIVQVPIRPQSQMTCFTFLISSRVRGLFTEGCLRAPWAAALLKLLSQTKPMNWLTILIAADRSRDLKKLCVRSRNRDRFLTIHYLELFRMH